MATYTVTFTITDPKDGDPFEQDILDAVNASPLRTMAHTWSLNKSRLSHRAYPTFFGGVSEDA